VGVVTVLGGSIMPPEVVAAMVEASKHFVSVPDLQVAAGKRIAEVIGVPAAMICCGAASGLTVATAACVTRGDQEKLRKLPDTTGMPNEVIVQKSHRFGFDTQIWMVGAKPVEVETREELDKAINDRTAMMFFLNVAEPKGQIERAEWVEVAKKNNIPTMNDCASDVPPVSRLRQYIDEGFDLAVFSGGKGLIGPQASGLVLGQPALVDAALKAISPRAGVGRGMKVGKEEIMGLVAAVERYHRVDHAAERKELDMRADHVIKTLADVDGVETEIDIPPIANQVPHVLVKWDGAAKGLAPGDAVKKLREGEPSIAVSQNADGLRISMWMLQPGEHEIVATRVKELFA
jgi:L-seryl-tRNA(Ser) seleniumtransferase